MIKKRGLALFFALSNLAFALKMESRAVFWRENYLFVGLLTNEIPENFFTFFKCKGIGMKLFFVILLCPSATSMLAQKTVDVTQGNVSALSSSFFNVVAGEPVVSAKFAKIVDGTPYFRDEWMKGTVAINGDNQFPGVYLKLDLFNNEVHYRDPKGNELIATTSIKELILFDSSAQLVFNFINGEYVNANSPVRGWYQLLVEGKASVFKKIKKQMSEDKPYGSATIEQSVHTSFQYYLLYNGNFIQVKKFKELPDVLIDKKNEIIQYIKANNLSGKTDDDYRSVFNHYNGLR
jgi:hypothetical protein